MTGMYVGTNSMLGVRHDPVTGTDYINSTQPHTATFSAQLEQLARTGVNTVMLYAALSYPPQQLEQLMDDLQVVGIHVVMMIVGAITPLAEANSSTAWASFANLINRLKEFENLLGWYVCGELSVSRPIVKLPLPYIILFSTGISIPICA